MGRFFGKGLICFLEQNYKTTNDGRRKTFPNVFIDILFLKKYLIESRDFF